MYTSREFEPYHLRFSPSEKGKKTPVCVRVASFVFAFVFASHFSVTLLGLCFGLLAYFFYICTGHQPKLTIR